MENGYKEEIEKLLKDTDDIDFQIRRLKYLNQGLTAENDKEINILQKEMENVEFKMKDAFIKTKEDKIQTEMGYTTWKVLKDAFVFKEGAIEEIEKRWPKKADKYIKTSKTLIKDPLKKDLIEGSLDLECCELVPQEKKFVYKYTGGNK